MAIAYPGHTLIRTRSWMNAVRRLGLPAAPRRCRLGFCCQVTRFQRGAPAEVPTMRVVQNEGHAVIELSEDDTASLMGALRTFLELLRASQCGSELHKAADRGF